MMKSPVRITMTGFRRRRVTLFCLLSALMMHAGGLRLVFPPVLAQSQTEQEEFYPLEAVPEGGEQPLEGPLHPLLREALPLESQALEGIIDAQTYRLGPGDLIGVNVLGDVDKQLLARVSADGVLRFSTLGIIDVAGKTLAQAKAEILTAAQRSYRTDEIAVYLVQLRNFKASVGGMVWAPGTYEMTATDRVVALLARAGGFYNPQRREETLELTRAIERAKMEEKIPELPSYSARRAKLIHLDGTADQVDLLLFLRAGSPEGNPYLRDGDFLLVPPLNPKSGVMGIYGAVHRQGLMEFVSGDNLERALLLAGGLTDDAKRDSVEIVRFIGAKTEYKTFCVNLDDPDALQTPLAPDDRIFIRSRPLYHPRRQVEVRGEVMKPGFYPIAEGGSPLVEIIRLAGGFTAKASLKEATLTRQFGQELLDPEYERLRLMQAKDMTPLEYQYFKIKSQEIKGRVVVDLQALFREGDSTQNLLLRHQDIVEIPPLTHAVKVTGQVNQPGIVAFEPGQEYSYYIGKSGGFTWNASRSRTRIIKAVSGKWVKPGHTIIEEGDTIFIPEKPDRDYWQTYKDVMLVLTQFATIYLIILNANR